MLKDEKVKVVKWKTSGNVVEWRSWERHRNGIVVPAWDRLPTRAALTKRLYALAKMAPTQHKVTSTAFCAGQRWAALNSCKNLDLRNLQRILSSSSKI